MNRGIKILAGVAVCCVCSAVAIEGYAPTLTIIYGAELAETGFLTVSDTAMANAEDSVFIVGGLSYDEEVCPFPYQGSNLYGFEVWYTFQAYEGGATPPGFTEYPYSPICGFEAREATDNHTALTVASGGGGTNGEVWVGGFERIHTGGGGGGPMRPTRIGGGLGRGGGFGRGGRSGRGGMDDEPALPFPYVGEEPIVSATAYIDGQRDATVLRYLLNGSKKLRHDGPDNKWSAGLEHASQVVDVVAGGDGVVFAMIDFNPGGGDSSDVMIVKLKVDFGVLDDVWSTTAATSGTQNGVGLAYYNNSVYYLVKRVPTSGSTEFQWDVLNATTGAPKSTGTRTWVTSNGAFPADLAVDVSGGTYDGYCYLTGYVDRGFISTLDDFATIRVDSSGNRDTGWTKFYDGGRSQIQASNDRAVGVRVDETNGDVWVGGYGQFDDPNWDAYSDFVSVEYSGAGKNDEDVDYEDFGGTDYPLSVGIDADGRFHIAGYRIVSGNKRMIIAHWEANRTKTSAEDSTGITLITKSAVDPTSGDVYLIGFDYDPPNFEYHLRMLEFDFDGSPPLKLKN